MRLRKLIDHLFSYLVYGLFFFTPFLFNPTRSYPSSELFEWSKMAFVYLITILILATWSARMIIYKERIFKRSPIDLAVVLFFISQALATLFSLDRHVSFFGYYSRFHGGLISIICYTLLFFALSANRDIINHKKLLYFAVSAGVLVSVYGILEHFGIDKSMWVQDVQSRVFSTFGQPNWLAAFIVIIAPLLFIFFFSPPSTSDSQQHTLKSRALILISSLILYTCLLFTKSRSGFLGFWAAHVIFWGLLLVRAKNRQQLLRLLGILMGSYLILNFFLKTPFEQYNNILTIDIVQITKALIVAPPQQTSGGSALENDSVTDSGDIRRIVWKGALAIIKEYPLFGTGPETFAYAYYKYRPVEHNLTSEWDFLYNRAHNEFLNLAATSGIIGLLAYFYLYSSIIWWALQKYKHAATVHQQAIPLSLIALFIGTAITNFFGFSVVMIAVFLYLTPLLFLVKNTEKIASERDSSITSNQWLLLGTTALLASAGIWWVVQLWRSDSFYAVAASLRRGEQGLSAYTAINTALAIRPDEPVYWDEKAQITTFLSQAALEEQNATLSAQFAKEAISASKEALTISPQNVNFWKTRTRMLFQFANLDPSFAQNALESIEIAQSLAPTDAKIVYNRAIIEADALDTKHSIETLKKALILKPNYKDAYLALAVFYKREGNFTEAIATIKTALSKVNPNDGELLQKLAELSTASQSAQKQ